MNLNDVRQAEREGTLARQSMEALKSMREICAEHIQSGDPSAVPIKQSVDHEIRRKEAGEAHVGEERGSSP